MATTTTTTTDATALKAAGDAYNAAKAAGDTAGMAAAHQQAETIRAKSGYSGGSDGSQVIATSGAATSSGTGTSTYAAKGTYNDAEVSVEDKAALTTYGQQYNAAVAAGDTAAAEAAHQQAELIRSKYQYSGGNDGSENLSWKTNDTTSTPSTSTTATPDYLSEMESLLSQWKSAAETQATNKQDYATKQGIDELQRAMDDAQSQYDTQRNQIVSDAATAQDNSALYSEVRGDKGGVGQAQYNSISANALKAKQDVNSAQTKLSTDTARQIADLRAQGEFEKADSVLEIAQNYLSQLVSLEQWGAEYDLDYQQFQESIREWEQGYELSVAQVTGAFSDGTKTLEASSTATSQLASIGESLLSAGVMPNASQLSAMGMTEAQAQQYILAAQLAAKSSSTGTGGKTTTTTTEDADTAAAVKKAASSLTLPAAVQALSKTSQEIYTQAVAQMQVAAANGESVGLQAAFRIANTYFNQLDAADRPSTAEQSAIITQLVENYGTYGTRITDGEDTAEDGE